MHFHIKITFLIAVCFDFIDIYAVKAHESATPKDTDLKHVTSFPDLQNQSKIILWQTRKRDFEAQQLEITQAKQYLEEFIGFLRSFVTKRSFDSVRFDQLAHMLRFKLFEIIDWVSILPSHKTISDQLEHAKNLFYTMCYSAEVYKFYPHQERDHSLIRTVSFMNLRLLTLCDSRGEPEYQTPLFKKIVAYMSVNLDFLEQSATEVNTTFKLQQLFDEQLREARDRIKILTG
ncbi:hypothetical protein OXX80_008558 [Metschnikowia pulcherrima]